MTTGRAGRAGPFRQRAISLALIGILTVGAFAACGTACPAALLEGVLVRDGAALVVQSDDGQTTAVQWPGGYSVATEGALLVVKDLFGSVKAREGNSVHLGGGMVGNPETAFGVCGDLTVDNI